jgi:hypothetical protein
LIAGNRKGSVLGSSQGTEIGSEKGEEEELLSDIEEEEGEEGVSQKEILKIIELERGKEVEEESTSEEDDLVEVTEGGVEIVVDPTASLDEDIFADVFSENPSKGVEEGPKSGGSNGDVCPRVEEQNVGIDEEVKVRGSTPERDLEIIPSSSRQEALSFSGDKYKPTQTDQVTSQVEKRIDEDVPSVKVKGSTPERDLAASPTTSSPVSDVKYKPAQRDQVEDSVKEVLSIEMEVPGPSRGFKEEPLSQFIDELEEDQLYFPRDTSQENIKSESDSSEYDEPSQDLPQSNNLQPSTSTDITQSHSYGIIYINSISY